MQNNRGFQTQAEIGNISFCSACVFPISDFFSLSGALLCNFRPLNVESCFTCFLEAYDSKYSTSCFSVGLHQLCKIHDVVPNQDQSKSVNIGN